VTVSARSSGRVNVQLIMEELGGGGHQTVAGVKIKKAQVDELKAQIIELVKKQMEESEAGEGDSTAR
jgi:c-di-AMP phosphodiesterase-like protein